MVGGRVGPGTGPLAPRTMAVVLDEEGAGPCLLPLPGQMHQAPAQRGQRPGVAHGSEELQQVRPEDLRGSRVRLSGASAGVTASEGLPGRHCSALGGWRVGGPGAPRTVQKGLGGGAGGEWSVTGREQRPHTHVAHPVHRGADQVEGPDADGAHAVRRELLAVRARLLGLGVGGKGRALWWGVDSGPRGHSLYGGWADQ